MEMSRASNRRAPAMSYWPCVSDVRFLSQNLGQRQSGIKPTARGLLCYCSSLLGHDRRGTGVKGGFRFFHSTPHLKTPQRRPKGHPPPLFLSSTLSKSCNSLTCGSCGRPCFVRHPRQWRHLYVHVLPLWERSSRGDNNRLLPYVTKVLNRV